MPGYLKEMATKGYRRVTNLCSMSSKGSQSYQKLYNVYNLVGEIWWQSARLLIQKLRVRSPSFFFVLNCNIGNFLKHN